MSEFKYYSRIVNNKVVELSVESNDKIEYVGEYNGEEFCEFTEISKEDFIRIGATLNMFAAPIQVLPLFIQD